MEFEKKELSWVEYDLLKDHPNIEARTFQRHGGISEKNFFSLNLSNKVGDHPDSVKVNVQKVKESLGVSNIVFPNQTHSNKVLEVTKDSFHKNLDADALVTNEKDIALAILHADCQACFFYDPEYKVIAIAHASYKNLSKGIYKNTIDFMEEKFNSRPENILACISPSICEKHSEIKDFEKIFPKDFWQYQVKPNFFDLKKMALDLLKESNITEDNIEISNDCTYLDEENYFSVKRDHKTGRHGSFIFLK